VKHTLVLLAPGLEEVPDVLRSAFLHPWVASYQIGFGPPLVGSSEGLRDALRDAKGALDKLYVYFRHCVIDDAERFRLVALHRRLVVRRQGPVEAEALDASYADVIDLRMRLRRPHEPPPGRREVTWPGVLPAGPDADLEGRIVVRLDDPRGERLLHHELVSGLATDAERDAALEVQVDADAASAWSAWLDQWSEDSGYRGIGLRRPLPHARQTEDGRSM